MFGLGFWGMGGIICGYGVVEGRVGLGRWVLGLGFFGVGFLRVI